VPTIPVGPVIGMPVIGIPGIPVVARSIILAAAILVSFVVGSCRCDPSLPFDAGSL
jgi:hypothetical protein